MEEIERIGRERKVERPIGSLIHDGLTVRKELEIELYRERIERHVACRTSYVLKLEIKAIRSGQRRPRGKRATRFPFFSVYVGFVKNATCGY